MAIHLSITCKEVEKEHDEMTFELENISEREFSCALAAAINENKFLNTMIRRAVLLAAFSESAITDSDSENSPDVTE